MDTREEHIFRAKLSEQAERFDEMVDEMRKVVYEGKELSVEERNMLSVAFKNIIGTRRTSWRILSAIEAREQTKIEQAAANEESEDLKKRKAQLEQTQNYRDRVEKELDKICTEIIELLDKHLIPASTTSESKVFYLKMKGDYFRYRAEFASGTEKSDIADKSCEAYIEASKIAEDLPPTQPIRLGLALNFSVFYYEIMNKCDKACELATSAFDKAMQEMDNLTTDENYKDSTLIMQLLRDNLTLWRSSDGDDAEGQDGN